MKISSYYKCSVMDIGENFRESIKYERKLFSDLGKLIILIIHGAREVRRLQWI